MGSAQESPLRARERISETGARGNLMALMR